jgi:hypothetical protein
MTRKRHILVGRYLVSEGGLPYAKLVERTVLDQPEGTVLMLPPPFESVVIVGVVRRGVRSWARDHRKGYRLIVRRGPKENDLDNLIVEIPLRALAELTRRYYE